MNKEDSEMKMVEREAYQFFTTLSVPKLYKVNSDGRAKKLTVAMPAVIRTVEIRSWRFNDGSISLTSLISERSVANSVVIKQTTIPTELMMSG